MAARDQQVQPAIVVGVEELASPRNVWKSRLLNPRLLADDLEDRAAFVMVERLRLLGKGRYEQIGLTVVVIIAPIDSHAGVVVARFIHGCAGRLAHILEATGAYILEQISRHQ